MPADLEGRVELVSSWEAAQRAVPFALHRPVAPAERITVRGEGPSTWPTVRSEHRFRGTRLRLKQGIHPWGPSTFPPLLTYLAGGSGIHHDHVYGPPLTVVRSGGTLAVHAGHYLGGEGGAAVLHMALLDLRVLEGRLGPDGLRAFLRGMSWASPLSSSIHRRPLSRQAWNLRRGVPYWDDGPSPGGQRMRWSRPRGSASLPLGVGRGVRLPPLAGYRPDCMGILSGPREVVQQVHLCYRPTSGHFPLGVFIFQRRRPPERRAGPLYRTRTFELSGRPVRATTAIGLGSARLDARVGGLRVLATLPPPLRPSDSVRDLRNIAQILEAIASATSDESAR